MCLWAESPSEGDRHTNRESEQGAREGESERTGKRGGRKTGNPIRRKEQQARIDRRGEGRRDSKRQTEHQSVFFSSDRTDMAENNTNLLLEILQSFDAGELFLTSLVFSFFIFSMWSL